MKYPCLLIISGLLFAGCQQKAQIPVPHTMNAQSMDSGDWKKRIMYLVIPDRFYNGDSSNDSRGISPCFDTSNPKKFHGGDLKGLEQKLSYIKDLGANAVWITPVYKQVGVKNDSCGYHGYWADFKLPFDNAMEPKLGTAAELTGLIDATHANDMKFILDMVVNHAGYGATIASTRPDWFNPECAVFSDIPCPLKELPDFKQERSDVSDYLIQESKGWLTKFPKIDSIRMDTVKHVPKAFFNQWIPAMNATKNDLFHVGELLDGDSLDNYKNYIKTPTQEGFDSLFNFYVRTALVKSFAKGESLDILATRMDDTLKTFGLERSLLMTNLVDNHDVPRFTNEIEDAIGYKPDDIRARYHLALTALMTLPGIPQIFYGNEIGAFGATDPYNRPDMPAWAWSLPGGGTGGGGAFLPNAQQTYTWTKKLIQIRKDNAALYEGNYTELWRPNGSLQDVFAFYRGFGTSKMVVAFNNSASATTLTFSVPATTGLGSGSVLKDQLGMFGASSNVTVTGSSLTLNLPAKSAVILKADRIATPTTTKSNITFQVKASTWFGQSVFLVGNHADLGNWDTNKAISLTSKDCSGTTCTWTATVPVETGSALAFKFLKKASGSLQWETGSDRNYTVPSTAATTDGGTFRE
ncbi:MAG: alpha-amylase family glycosyl hydrolase [Deinococcaceae bacterium]